MSKLNKKQLVALKYAIRIMERNFNRYCMSYMCCGGEKVGYGEAINILSDMVNQEAKSDTEQEIRAKTIDDFAERLKSYVDCGHLCSPTEIRCSDLDIVKMIDEIAEEMRCAE